MYGNVKASLLWLILLAKNLFNKFNLKKSNTDSYIFYNKYDDGKLELVMSVHVDDVFMAGKPEKLEKTKEKIKLKVNFQE